MLSKSATPPEVIAMETPQQQMENHPVIRTLYDHNGVRFESFQRNVLFHVYIQRPFQWIQAQSTLSKI